MGRWTGNLIPPLNGGPTARAREGWKDVSELLDVWSPWCKLTTGIRLFSGKVAPTVRAAITIAVEPGESQREVLTNALFGDHTFLPYYDVLVIWSCRCTAGTKVVWRRVEDIPNTLGYHGACPACGQAVLHVVEQP